MLKTFQRYYIWGVIIASLIIFGQIGVALVAGEVIDFVLDDDSTLW
jgi:hypothetical protein